MDNQYKTVNLDLSKYVKKVLKKVVVWRNQPDAPTTEMQIEFYSDGSALLTFVEHSELNSVGFEEDAENVTFNLSKTFVDLLRTELDEAHADRFARRTI